MTEHRAVNFCRNERLESLLAELGENLRPSEDRLMAGYRGQAMRYPLILVMGPLRSGTTLFTQWLANTGIAAYPTNFLSRFYEAPIIGAKIQLLLTDPRYNFRDELGDFVREVDYFSENGKTRGVLAPNEFWYFWRRFLAEPSRDVWTDGELRESMDVQTMLSELAGMMDVFNKPFLAKGMLFNYNISFLDSIFDKVVFVYTRRDPVSNIESIMTARKRQFETIDQWYSFRIPEYEKLSNLGPHDQVAGQVFYINKAIQAGLGSVADERKLVVEYEEFCSNPGSVYEQLLEKLAGNDCMVTDPYRSENRFHVTRRDVNDPEVLDAYRKYYG